MYIIVEFNLVTQLIVHVYDFSTTVILSGGSSNTDFKGFLIQGRTMTNTATGTFVDNGDDQQTSCSNVSA